MTMGNIEPQYIYPNKLSSHLGKQNLSWCCVDKVKGSWPTWWKIAFLLIFHVYMYRTEISLASHSSHQGLLMVSWSLS